MPNTTDKSQGKKPTDWRLWALLALAIVSLGYSIISTYAIRGNELLHLEKAMTAMQKQLETGFNKLERRIERLENREMTEK